MKLKPRFALYFLIPYLLGIVVGEYTSVPPFWTWLFTLGCLSCAVLLQRRARLESAPTGVKNKWLARLKSKVTFYVLLHLAVFASGILRLDIAVPSPIPSHFYNAPVSFSGQTTYQPERGKEWESCYANGELRLLKTGETVQAKILIRFQKLVPLRYGKRFTLTGTLHQPQPQRNPGGFDYRAYLSRKEVFGIMYHQGLLQIGEQAGFPPLRWIEALRIRTEEVIDEVFGVDPSDVLLLKNIMLRTRKGIDKVYGIEPSDALLVKGILLYIENMIDDALLKSLLLKGIMLGKRSDLPTYTVETFRNSGNLHLLAVSGLHVGFIAAFCYFSLTTFASVLGVFSKHPHMTKKVIVLLTIGAVLIYACLVGFRISVFRAALMAILFLFATVIDRDADIYNLLAFAALILLLLNPTQLWDIGFQLSFVAVTAIVYFVPKMEKPFRKLWEPPDARAEGTRIWNLPATLVRNALEQPILSYLAKRATWMHIGAALGQSLLKWLILSYLVTVAALLGTTPIIAFHFFRVYPLGVIVGPFAVLLVSFILALGMASVVAGLVLLLPLAKLFAWLNHVIISLFLAIIGLFGGASGVMKITPPTFGIFVVYIAICLGIAHWRFFREQWRLATLIGLVVVAIWVWDSALHEEGRLLEVVTLDVGQGDAAVVKFPDGRVMLVDGGIQHSYYNARKQRWAEYDAGERVVAPYLDVKGIRELELVVLSHPDIDHGGGLAHILENFKVERVLGIPVNAATDDNGDAAPSKVPRSSQEPVADRFAHLRKIADAKKIDYTFKYEGEIELTSTAKLKLLPPAASIDLKDTDTNNDSLVIKLSDDEVDILFTGDIEATAEEFLVKEYGKDLRAEILKVPHHGSGTSSTELFIDTVQPKFAIFSLGMRNRYGFPNAGVAARYRKRGCVILRTDELGAITLKTDGKRCWFRFHVAKN